MNTPIETTNYRLYHANYVSFAQAIMKVGGNPFVVLQQHHDFLVTLANNGISIDATAMLNPSDVSVPQCI